MDDAVKKYAVLSKKRLFLRLHALALPLGRLEDAEARAPRTGEGAKCAWEKDSAQGKTGGTDGRRVFWPPSILKSGGDTRPGEAFLLHQVLHCLLGHPFRRPPAGIGRERHDLDCDLAVWAHVKRLAPELFPESLARIPGELLEGRRGPGPEEEAMVCEALRALDDHSRWPIYGPAAARLRPDALVWRAPRRGLEPWKITAQFMSAGRTVRAEWSWNMHDNAVVCLNRTAGKLIGGRPADVPPPDDPEADDGFAAPLNLPGDSTRSALIEQTMSSWNTAENASAPAVQDSGAADAPESPDSAQSQDAPAAEPAQPVPAAADQSPTAKPKRRSGRSAVPSWDEILFGD